MSEREKNGWHTIEVAEENGQSLVEAYLDEQFREHQVEWGRAYGRAVFEAWPGEGPDLGDFVEERIAALEATNAGKPTALWNELGTPLQPHVACPSCLEGDEVGSHFDSAWCCFCGWRGSLTEQHARAALVNEVTAVVRDEIVAALPALGMTFVEVLVDRPVDDPVLPAATFIVRQFSCGYVETEEDATMVPTSPADHDLEVQ